MTPQTADALNSEFAIPGVLRAESGPGGLTVLRVTNALAEATVALHGAHVLSYTPAGATDLLWLSRMSHFAPGQPIRGGIPICWPWFGAHPSESGFPNHGFARLLPWTLLAAEGEPDGPTHLVLELRDSDATRAWWPAAFSLTLALTVGAELRLELMMLNAGRSPVSITAALHTYFHVGDIGSTRVIGLDGCPYLDTVGGANRRHTQSGDVTFTREVDRIYQDASPAVTIEAPALNRRIHVAKAGSRSTVVWNPWIAKAARMPDFGDDEYRDMLCVETANARDDRVTLAPGASHVTAQILTLR